MKLLFLHGWGFDASFWQPLTALLPGWPVQCDDRGYFGPPRPAASGQPFIYVTHSFGAMRALAAPLPGLCRGMVAINGFDRFTGEGAVSPRIVERMIAKFAEEPAAVLSDFRRRCGDDAPFGPADIARLGEDLRALRDDDHSAAAAVWPVPILLVQGSLDPLLPAPLRESAFAAAPLVERLAHPSAGHLLPVQDAPYCAQAISAFAERAG